MAKKGGKRGSSAARSAAAKKGWETRRRGGAKASTPSKPKATPKTTTARGRARTAETRARAAVRSDGGTRAARSLLTAQRARDWYKATGSGTKRSKVRTRVGSANGIRRTGGLPRPVAGNNIKPIKVSGNRNPLLTESRRKVKGYANQLIKVASIYNKGAANGSTKKGAKSIETAKRAFAFLKAPRNNIAPSPRRGALPPKPKPTLTDRLSKVRTAANAGKTRLARRAARDIANRSKKGIDGELARISMSAQGGRLNRAGADVIRRRAARATAAAARGSKPAARARAIYGQQLAGTGTGKPSRKAKSGIRPGPRNTKGTPPKRRKRKR